MVFGGLRGQQRAVVRHLWSRGWEGGACCAARSRTTLERRPMGRRAAPPPLPGASERTRESV